MAARFTAGGRRRALMKRLAFLFLVVAAGWPRCILAQVTAAQGANAAEAGKQTEFASPMVLDIPFPDFQKLPPEKPWTTTEASRYFCEGVGVASLTVIPGKARKTWLLDGSGKERVVEYMLEMSLRVLPSQDRIVDLLVELRLGDRTLASTAIRGIDAEEEKVKRARANLVARAADVASLFTGEAKPMLRLTMSVH